MKRNIKVFLSILTLIIITTQISTKDVSAETIDDKKYVTNQMTANYNDGKYKGTLS